MAFLDDEDELGAPPEPERPRRPERELSTPQRRRQQFMLRRLMGVGVGILFLILLVVGVRGCLEARSDRGLRNYSQSIATIMQESQVRGEEFFAALQDDSLSEQDLENQISGIRSASTGLLERAENVDVPDQARESQSATTQALRLRRDALDNITAEIGAAQGDAETANPLEVITQQMGSLYASDILWSQLSVPELESVLEEEGVDAPEFPAGNFMPENDPTRFLDETEIVDLITSLGGEEDTGGIRGLELVQVNVGDTTLSPDTTTTVADDAREISVQVTNGGEQTERAVEIVVNFGDEELTEPIPTIEPGATEEAALPLDTIPQPGTEVQIDVLVTPVDGEQATDNNQAVYTVVFGTG